MVPSSTLLPPPPPQARGYFAYGPSHYYFFDVCSELP